MSEFLPIDYLNTFFGPRDQYDPPFDPFLTFSMRCLHHVFAAGELKGRMIDIGSGPTIHNVISASAHCDNVICSDYSQPNLTEIRKWLSNEPGAFDWSPYFSYVTGLDGKGSGKVRQAKVRKLLTGHVITCDVTKDDVLCGNHHGLFDIVMSSLCIEQATQSAAEYLECLPHLTKLLKPGGDLLLLAVTNQSFYQAGSDIQKTAPVTGDIIKPALESLGFKILYMDSMKRPDPIDLKWCDYDGGVFFRAKMYETPTTGAT